MLSRLILSGLPASRLRPLAETNASIVLSLSPPPPHGVAGVLLGLQNWLHRLQHRMFPPLPAEVR